MEKKIYFIDLPNPYDLEGPWINVQICRSEVEMKQWMWDHFGTKNDSIQIVTDSDIDE